MVYSLLTILVGVGVINASINAGIPISLWATRASGSAAIRLGSSSCARCHSVLASRPSALRMQTLARQRLRRRALKYSIRSPLRLRHPSPPDRRRAVRTTDATCTLHTRVIIGQPPVATRHSARTRGNTGHTRRSPYTPLVAGARPLPCCPLIAPAVGAGFGTRTRTESGHWTDSPQLFPPPRG